VDTVTDIGPDGVTGSGEASALGVLARDVTRGFGPVQALRGLHLSVPYGKVTALVGPNGAGKTTLLLILATLLRPDTGEVRVAGLDPIRDPAGVRARMGWMPDTFGVYDQLTVREYLRFFTEAYRIDKRAAIGRIDAALGHSHLADYADRPVHVLSRGQKQRLALGRSLLHEPSVLLLDEPASGLDPRSRVELRDLLRQLTGNGVAILVSSHILTELEEIADRVVFVTAGRTVDEQDIRQLAAATMTGWRIRAQDPDALARALTARGMDTGPSPDAGTQLPPMTEDQAADLLAGLVSDGVRVVAFGPVGSHLESAYLAMTQERR
jgi:ABC-2 type transport system ATP-binding protein